MAHVKTYTRFGKATIHIIAHDNETSFSISTILPRLRKGELYTS